MRGDAAMVELLLQSGADANERENVDRWTPLHVTSNPKVASTLVDAGADVNAEDRNGNTPLLMAITDPTGFNPAAQIAELVRCLVEAGARVRVVGEDGWSALHIAISRALAGTVKILLQAGADVCYAPREPGTPLHLAANYGQVGIVTLLLGYGAPVNNVRTSDGWTPLHEAARSGAAGVTRALIDAGGDVRLVDKRGRPPLHYARDHRVRQLLLNADAGREHET
jgi:ankyrin repeat protein